MMLETTAKQARVMAEKRNKTNNDALLLHIETQIFSTAEKGGLSVYIYERLNREIINVVRGMGFKVEEQEGRGNENSFYKITW